MKTILQIAAGILIAVAVLVGVIAFGHVNHQQDDVNQQQAEFCKKAKAQGMDLNKVGCQQ